MKRWISPPVQLLFWLGGIACLAAAAWNMWQLRQVTVAQHMARSNVQIAIPDAKALDVPGIGRYRQLVQAPLFWEERAIPRPVIQRPPPPQPVVARAPEPEIEEVLLNPPLGRLVGIVDLGTRRYALVRNEAGNQSLYRGDEWEGWKVTKVDSDKVVLKAGKQKAEIPLIADFAAPQPNKQMLAANQRRQHRKRQQHMRIQRQRQQMLQQQAQARANAAQQGGTQPGLDQAGAGNSLNNQQVQDVRAQLEQALNVGNDPDSAQQGQPTPVLSIKEALEARQRLMASRWGNKKSNE